MEIIAPVVVDAFAKLKEYNEVLMARELYGVYEKTPELMRDLRAIAYYALLDLSVLHRDLKLKGKENAFQKAIEADTVLKLWGETEAERKRNVNINTLRKLKDRGERSLNARECADICRLYGTVVEKLAEDESLAGKCTLGHSDHKLSFDDWNEIRRSYRAITIFQSPEMQKLIPSEGKRRAMVEQEKELIAQKMADKKAGRKPKKPPYDYEQGEGPFVKEYSPFHKQQRRKRGLKDPRLDKEHLRYAKLSGHDRRAIQAKGKEAKVTAGMSIFRLLPGSTTYAIDRLFGLPTGADISGTTADTMFTLEMIANILWGKLAGKQSHFITLLPLVSMVSHYHHTVLECALPLTFNGNCEYSVGFYTSLVPKGYNLTKGWEKELYGILKKWEDHPTNFKMLIFDSQEKESDKWGVCMTTKDELKRFRELGRVSYERYMMFLDKLKDKKKITPPDVMEHVGLLPAEIRTIRTRELIKAIQERMRLRKLVGDVY